MFKRARSRHAARHPVVGARHALFAAAVLAGLGSLASTAAAQPLSAREQSALDVRYLQTELMVAALSCGRTEFHQHYNTFVAKFGGALKRHAAVMKGYFSREYGNQGTVQLDRYVTRLANEASLRSMQQAAFCQDSITLFERVTVLDPASLEGFSAAVARNREMVAAGTTPVR